VSWIYLHTAPTLVSAQRVRANQITHALAFHLLNFDYALSLWPRRGVLFTQQDYAASRAHNRTTLVSHHRLRENIIATQSEKKQCVFGHPSTESAGKEMRW
jgi:hypothetical protein